MLDVCDFYNRVIIAPRAYGLFINKTETLNCFLPFTTNIVCSLISTCTLVANINGILTSVDSDEPMQPPFKLRNSICCSVSSLKLIEYSSDKQRL